MVLYTNVTNKILNYYYYLEYTMETEYLEGSVLSRVSDSHDNHCNEDQQVEDKGGR